MDAFSLGPSGAVYEKPTVVLIDERAQSAAETVASVLKTVNNSVLIGSRTTGANGEVREVFLPGGLAVQFTANDARGADGSQSQRIGLKPDIEVRPTINGIRAGRDEVLERAVTYLQNAR